MWQTCISSKGLGKNRRRTSCFRVLNETKKINIETCDLGGEVEKAAVQCQIHLKYQTLQLITSHIQIQLIQSH